MKKIFKGLAALCLSAAMITGFSATTGVAATTLPDNYGAYLVAAGQVTGGDGYTGYYTKIGDGNATLIFDLLSVNSTGYFGFLCGDADTVKDLSTIDYIFTGESVKTTFDFDTNGLAFDAGYTYKAVYVGDGEKSLTVYKKAIGSLDSEYTKLFETAISTAKSNLVGIATLSNGLRSGSVIIDNFTIVDPYGDVYVDNSFNAGKKISDDGMKNFSVNAQTGDQNKVGSVYIHNSILLTVRFVDESGSLIATQKVCLYGSATSPTVPEKEGYTFVRWSQSLDEITQDMLVYPIYEVKEDKPEESIPEESIPEESIPEETTSEESTIESETSQPESQSKESTIESQGSVEKPKGGCKGSFAGGLIGLSMLALGVLAIKRRDK